MGELKSSISVKQLTISYLESILDRSLDRGEFLDWCMPSRMFH